MSFARKLAKSIVGVSIALLLITALFSIGLGAYIQLDPHSAIVLSENYLVTGLYIVGGILLLVSVLGMIAAKSKNGFFYLLFVISMVSIMALEAWLLYQSPSFDGYHLWKHLPFDKREILQEQLDCCGYNSTIPKDSNTACTSDAYCADKIKLDYRRFTDYSAYAGIALLLFQMFTLMSMTLLYGLRRGEKEAVGTDKTKGYSNRNQRILEEARAGSR